LRVSGERKPAMNAAADRTASAHASSSGNVVARIVDVDMLIASNGFMCEVIQSPALTGVHSTSEMTRRRRGGRVRCSLRDVQDYARHADPRQTRRYDRARGALDRNPTYIVATYVAGATGAR
jgi:hypothetical protein